MLPRHSTRGSVVQGQFFVVKRNSSGVRRARTAALAALVTAMLAFGVVPNAPGAQAAVRGPVAHELPDDVGSGSTDSSSATNSSAEGTGEETGEDSAPTEGGTAAADGVGETDAAEGTGDSGGAAADPAPEEPPTTPPSDEARGSNGEIASTSPGPDSAKPWPGDEAMLRESVQAASSGGGRGTVLGNDYPAKYKNLPWPYTSSAMWDEWNFAYRQCTSFVSWRLNSANGVPFSNQYKGLERWGDAGQWANSARSVGFRVDTTPEVGAIAWSGPYYADASVYGHVAWVSRVLDNGNIVIEEYNYGWAGSYGTRTVKPNAFQGYIHINDLTKPFAKAPVPTISGAHSANSELTVNTPGWSPAPTTMRYQWLRNGAAISGAKGKTYTPSYADIGAKLTVEVTGIRAGYTAQVKRSAATGTIMMPDLDGNGIDDTQELMPWNTDVNGDGLPDVVGFHPSGPQVALRTRAGTGKLEAWGTEFGTKTGWKSMLDFTRALVDVNGDGKSDIVGFGTDGIYVSLSTGSAFKNPAKWSGEFAVPNGYNVKEYPRGLADVTGDGLPDVIGFGMYGPEIAVNTGSSFAKATRWVTGYGTSNGWRPDNSRRFLTDMNGDGRADVVGISTSGVHVSLSTGSAFSNASLWTSNFGGQSGWKANAHLRTLADVNGDGLPDVVGFGAEGVYVMLNTGKGLGAMRLWVSGFDVKRGWKLGVHPRVLADVNGDGLADIVGFGSKGTSVALSTGSSFKGSTTWSAEFGADSWRSDIQPRFVTDVNGDGRADLVGFADAGVRVALSSGAGFNASKLELDKFGAKAVGWRVIEHPRGIGLQTLSKRPTPVVRGTARVGEKLSASVGAWQPAPVARKQQWTRNGKAISGATSTSYTLTPSDVGADIAFKVNASKPGFAGVARTSTKQKVAKGHLKTVVPTIEGAAKVGTKLTARAGSWGPGDVALTYQWNRGGKPIRNATKQSYQLAREDVGRRVTVTVTGAKTAYETAARTSEALRVPGTPELPASSPFGDVTTGHKFYREIAWMATSGMSTGVKQPSGKPHYQPREAVSREAMAAFLFRLAAPGDYVAPAVSPFVDIPVNHKFYREIAWMATSGLSTGSAAPGGRAYLPRDAVSREAMAAFIYRLERAKESLPSQSPFVDMQPGDRFYREISWMYSHGLSTGVAAPGGRAYTPKAHVSREAMAAFLFRLETR